MTPQITETHQRTTRINFGAREFRSFIIDALRKRKVDVSGDLQITFTGVGYRDSVSAIGGGPNVYIEIRQHIEARG